MWKSWEEIHFINVMKLVKQMFATSVGGVVFVADDCTQQGEGHLALYTYESFECAQDHVLQILASLQPFLTTYDKWHFLLFRVDGPAIAFTPRGQILGDDEKPIEGRAISDL